MLASSHHVGLHCRNPVTVFRQKYRPARLVVRAQHLDSSDVAAPTAATAAAAATENDPATPSQQSSSPRPVDSRDRKASSKKPSRKPQQTALLQEGPAAEAGPLPVVLAATFPDTFPTLSAARRVIRKDLILVDGQLGNCKTDVAVGQQLQQLEPVGKSKGPRAVSLQVLYEDDDLAVVHKPWGVKMYGGDVRRTITGALKAGALQPSSRTDALPEPKPLHRLDAAVGGVLLIAKTSSAAADISRQFVERRVHKVYHALLCGQLLPGAVLSMATAPAPFQQQSEAELELQQHTEGSVSSSESTSGSSPLDVESASSDPNSSDASSSSAVGSADEEEVGQSDLDDPQEGESAQQLPLEELLQRQLLGTPAFTVTMQDLADPVLQSVADCIPAGSTSSSSGDSSSSSSSSSGGGGSGSSSSGDTGGLGIGADVHVVDLPVEGRPSYSLYKVLGYSRSSRYGGWVTSVALSPVTGRKHQLRRHMAALGCPIVGDGKYALNKEEHISNQGIYLESLEIAFTHPSTQQQLHISMPEPQRFYTMRQQLQNRWRKLSQQGAQEEAGDDIKSTASTA